MSSNKTTANWRMCPTSTCRFRQVPLAGCMEARARFFFLLCHDVSSPRARACVSSPNLKEIVEFHQHSWPLPPPSD
jgi:hypothetical protein